MIEKQKWQWPVEYSPTFLTNIRRGEAEGMKEFFESNTGYWFGTAFDVQGRVCPNLVAVHCDSGCLQERQELSLRFSQAIRSYWEQERPEQKGN
jgi:hypothetical protein